MIEREKNKGKRERERKKGKREREREKKKGKRESKNNFLRKFLVLGGR